MTGENFLYFLKNEQVSDNGYLMQTGIAPTADAHAQPPLADFYISTYPLNGTNYVYQICFTNGSVATEEGIRFGDELPMMEGTYVAEHFVDANTCILTQVNEVDDPYIRWLSHFHSV